MNAGMVVLAGCLLGTGAIVYQGTMAGAAPAKPSPTPAAAAPAHATALAEPTVLAPTAAPSPTPTPTALPKLTLEQVRGIARPPLASAPVRTKSTPSGLIPETPTGLPSAAATPTNESAQAPAPTAIGTTGPTETPVPELPWLATPPPLPPPPEGLAPRAVPTEQPQ